MPSVSWVMVSLLRVLAKIMLVYAAVAVLAVLTIVVLATFKKW